MGAASSQIRQALAFLLLGGLLGSGCAHPQAFLLPPDAGLSPASPALGQPPRDGPSSRSVPAPSGQPPDRPAGAPSRDDRVVPSRLDSSPPEGPASPDQAGETGPAGES